MIHGYQRHIVHVLSIHMLVIYPAIHSPYEDRIKQIFIVFTAELYCKETKGIEKALGYQLVHCRCSTNQSKVVNAGYVYLHALNYINIMTTSKQKS